MIIIILGRHAARLTLLTYTISHNLLKASIKERRQVNETFSEFKRDIVEKEQETRSDIGM